MKLFYLHGFASAPHANDKVAALNKYYNTATGEDLEIIYVKYDPEKPVSAINTLDNIFSKPENCGDSMIAGTSLGGFWAAFCAIKYNIAVIAINPSVTPHLTLPLGEFEYFAGGKGEVTKTDMFDFEFYSNFIKGSHTTANITVCLAEDDAVLDYKVAAELFKSHEVIISTNGGHRFSEPHWSNNIVPTAGKNFFAMSDS